MRPTYHRNFKKQYKKLPPAQTKRFGQALALFITAPHHPNLYNHPLTGEWQGYNSISFGGDWRAHYKIVDKDTALFVAVGTHAQLYK